MSHSRCGEHPLTSTHPQSPYIHPNTHIDPLTAYHPDTPHWAPHPCRSSSSLGLRRGHSEGPNQQDGPWVLTSGRGRRGTQRPPPFLSPPPSAPRPPKSLLLLLHCRLRPGTSRTAGRAGGLTRGLRGSGAALQNGDAQGPGADVTGGRGWMRGRRGRELFPISLPSRPTRPPRGPLGPETPLRMQVTPMTSLTKGAPDFPLQPLLWGSPRLLSPSPLCSPSSGPPSPGAGTSSRSGSQSGMSSGTSPLSPLPSSGMVSWLLGRPPPGPGA